LACLTYENVAAQQYCWQSISEIVWTWKLGVLSYSESVVECRQLKSEVLPLINLMWLLNIILLFYLACWKK